MLNSQYVILKGLSKKTGPNIELVLEYSFNNDNSCNPFNRPYALMVSSLLCCNRRRMIKKGTMSQKKRKKERERKKLGISYEFLIAAVDK